MTDEQIGEIYALARESFFGGQRAFQIQAYPFRMTPLNMARHRNSPHMGFWRMLKQGYDHFEVTRLEPKVDVCDKRYVFDAETKAKFTATGKCPAYQVQPDVVAAVKDKQQQEEREVAELIRSGTTAAPIRMNQDGGMHPTFLASFQKPYLDGAGLIRSARAPLPGTIPPHARPPGEPNPEYTVAAVDTKSANNAARAGTRVAAAPATQSESSGGLFGNMFHWRAHPRRPRARRRTARNNRIPKACSAAWTHGWPWRIGTCRNDEFNGRPKAKVASKPAANGKTKSESKSDPKTTGTATATAAAARPPQPKHPSDQAAVQPEKTAQPEKPAKDASLMNGRSRRCRRAHSTIAGASSAEYQSPI